MGYKKNIVCPYCLRFFAKNEDLKKHHRAKHPDKEFRYLGIYEENESNATK